MTPSEISELVKEQGHRRALDQRFYSDPDVYQQDIDNIFLKSWLYAGHQSEIPNPGDWFLFEFANESIIIVRSEKGTISALVNVCRHRGSRIRTEKSGCSRRLTCPYHGWTYDLDGSLLVAAYMEEGFDKKAHSLRTLHCQQFLGMIFINFADEPAPFSSFQEQLGEVLEPYDLENTKVARRVNYPIEANWKLSLENYTECYHCATAHPEYSLGHSLAKPWRRSIDLMEAVEAKKQACGIGNDTFVHIYQDAPAYGADVSFQPYPMWNGHLTGSKDGKPIAPLLGRLEDYTGGANDMQLGPVTFTLLYCDHLIIYRFTPVSVDQSVCNITWLVRGDAEEGKDYNRDELSWLWDITTEADKRIIETNARGVASKYYIPGPYSNMEKYLWGFISWYLKTLGKKEDSPS